MNTKNPIKSYLAQSVHTNWKHVLLALFIILIAGVITVIARNFPAIAGVISEHISTEMVVDFPVKLAMGAAPIILIIKSKTYSEWKELKPNILITKKEYTTGIFLEQFLSAFFGVPVLAVIWVVASVADPGIVDNILTTGLIAVGQMFLLVWTMASLVYTLQFTRLGKNDQTLAIVCLFTSLWLAVALQWVFGGIIGLPAMLSAVLHTLIGLIVLPIGWVITARLYEKVDL